MFEFIIIFILLVAILVLLIYGIFIKPITYEENHDHDYGYGYDAEYDDVNEDENNPNEEFEIEEEELPTSRGYRHQKLANDVNFSKSSTGQYLLRIKSNTAHPELYPIPKGYEIILRADSQGIVVDHYHVE